MLPHSPRLPTSWQLCIHYAMNFLMKPKKLSECLGSHRPKPISSVAQWLKEVSIMHALLKRESLGSMLPTTGDNLLSSVDDASVQTCSTTQIYEDLLSMLQTHQDHLTANGSQVLVGYTMHQRGQGVTTTPANLATAAAHVGDLILPPCAACHNRGDETTLSGLGSTSSSLRHKILSCTPVHHPSSRLSI